MRTEVRRIVRESIAPSLNLAVAKRGDVLYRKPIGWAVCGYLLDWTAVDNFYLHIVAQGLYVPAVTWLLGERLPIPGKRSRAWGIGHENDLIGAMTAASPLLDSVGSIAGYVDYLLARADPKGVNPLAQEEIAYGRILMGISPSDQQSCLKNVLSLAANYPDDRWVKQAAERATLVLDAVRNGKSPLPYFEKWRSASLQTLKIAPEPQS